MMENNKKMLLVEDNKANTILMSKQLKMLGIEPDIAENGVTALEMFSAQRYDLVVTDCNMPIMDGYELARRIREYEQEQGMARTGIVAITADVLDGTAEKCYDAGMDEYVTKPVEVPAWKKLIDHWLSVAVETTAVQSTVATEVSAQSEEQAGAAKINKNALIDLLGIDEPEILSEYYLSYIESAEEILPDLHKAYASSDWLEVGDQGHKFKSSSRAIGADDLADTCLALERAGRDGDVEAIHQLMAVIDGQFDAVRVWVNSYSKAYS